MKQVYYETVRSGLVPVKDIEETEDSQVFRFTVKEATPTAPYRAGEVLTGHWWHLVTKVPRRSGQIFQRVRAINPDDFRKAGRRGE